MTISAASSSSPGTYMVTVVGEDPGSPVIDTSKHTMDIDVGILEGTPFLIAAGKSSIWV
jgi:hypothetical protein